MFLLSFRVRFPSVLAFALVLGLLALASAGQASSITVPLDLEFDDGTPGPHASVMITEDAGALDFVVSLAGTDLGPGADLHVFYFNLVGSPSGVTVSDTNAPQTAYALQVSPREAGGAGSSFDYGVHFGNGAGAPGNGVLEIASFTISADSPLTLASLLETSSTTEGLVVNFALHVQGTSLVSDVESETVGGKVPEPGAVLLLGMGLAAARAGRPRRRV